MITYGRQLIDEDDIQAVVDVLRSDLLTTGPKVKEFEQCFSHLVGVNEAVAVNSGTAALHAAMYALDIGPGDEVIVPAITFAATANCVVYQKGTPIFVDVCPDTLLIDPQKVESKINSRTRAVIAVDYAGQPADYDQLRKITDKYGLALVADACHSLGAKYKGRKTGSLADLSVFSFHPVKHITTGEGGMIATNDQSLATKMRMFRNHGIALDHQQREAAGTWFYEMVDVGFNYRLNDMQCALGISQLQKLPQWVARRQAIARIYDEVLSQLSGVERLSTKEDIAHAYHLYVVKIEAVQSGIGRADLFNMMRKKGIGVNVHYIPVHLHPFYMKNFGTGPGLCPTAENVYEKIITLPMHPGLRDEDVEFVLSAVKHALVN